MTKESMRFCGVERSTSHMNLYLELEVSHLQSIGTGKSTSSSVRSLRTISMQPVLAAKKSKERAVWQVAKVGSD